MVNKEELNEAKEPDIRHISEFVSLLAEEMLISGGETRRVEDCVDKILGSFGVDKYDHYIISNGIFMTTELEDKHHFTRMRYVPLGSVNLWKIGALNQLSRDVSDKKCSLDEAKTRLDEIKNTTVYSDRTLALCCAGFGGTSQAACTYVPLSRNISTSSRCGTLLHGILYIYQKRAGGI